MTMTVTITMAMTEMKQYIFKQNSTICASN
jgi:hypothetical protein